MVTAAVFLNWGTSSCLGQPANDLFANRALLTGTNVSVTGSNVGATWESGEPDHAGNTATASVWWTWTAPVGGTATIRTSGASFDTVLGVYTGSSLSSLTEIGSNDDEDFSAGVRTSMVAVEVTPGRTYQIAVDGYAGATGNILLSLVVGPAPSLVQAPAWTSPDPSGTLVRSSQYAGKVVLLNFWATWCGPCKAEMPDMVELQEKYAGDGLVIIGADGGWNGDTPAVVQSFLATWTPAVNYQVVMANDSMVQGYGGISAIPSTFVIDRQNLIRKKFVGSQTLSTLEKELVPLLYANTRVSVHPSATEVTLCWPSTARAFALETATNLIDPVWTARAGVPSVVDGTNSVAVPRTGPPRYFRLRMPN